ncbi:Endo-1,4-beta-xylanase [Paenibacillus curdlanolyticus YK9]|uniref:Beta-xylanase n=1 Tax=Paenibacillus curdlanolyticus YK9 TaxID=717606 RepID=E0IFB1_9BACL|nr:endo-1,4-beta-xylanase [Paenibacillus curdlanolyticus]EFM08887.1 Endo-1,4-beta-xylanase [Paenibacillus curdlanolyticus YK9]
MSSKRNAVLAIIMAVMLCMPQGRGASNAYASAVGDTVMSSSFDSGADGWFKRGSETVSQSAVTAQSGAGSLLTTGRSASWNGPGVNASALQPGATYEFSIYAKLKEGTTGSATVELDINQQGLPSNDPATYAAIDAQSVTAADWTLLQGQWTLDERAAGYQVYVQSTDNATVDYYVDSFSVKLVSLPAAQPPSVPPGSIIFQQSFEDGLTSGWENLSWNGTGTTEVSSAYASEGAKSLKFSGRDSRASSPTINLTSLMKSGHVYDVSLKARLGEGSDTLHVASKVDSPLLTNKYPWLIGDKSVTSSDWTAFELKNYEVPANTAELRIWLESVSSSTSKSDIYIDEVMIKDVTPNTTPDPGNVDQSGMLSDFESGQGAWVRRNGTGNIGVTTADNHTTSGVQSLLTTVSQQYDGPLLDVMGKMHKGYKYSLSAWVKMAPGQTATNLRISVQSGDSAFTNVSPNSKVSPDDWVQLTGTFTVATTPSVLNAYVEVADVINDSRAFYIDDFALTYIGPVAGPKPVQTDLDPLKDAYSNHFKIGAAVEPAQLEGDVHALLDYHYNSIVAENSTKPGSLNPSDGVWNWAAADKVALYAKNHNLDFRLHTLAWHEQAAEWMFKDASNQPLAATPANKQLVLDRLTTYIQTVTRHFKDLGVTINAVDVVNEVIDEGQPDGMRRSEWFRLTGTDFIKTAFTVARQELPNAKLYLNDFNTQDPKKRDFLYALVTSLKADGVPIDGIGHQTHINISGPSIGQISDSIRKFGEAGFDNQLTELDVSVYTNNSTSYEPIPEDILVKQGYRFKELFKELVRLDEMGKQSGNPDGWISNVTLWGVADDHTWLHNRGTTRQDAPFPFDKQYQAKYAYWGMIEAVKTLNPSHLPLTAKAANTGQGTPVVDHVTDSVWSTVPAMKTEQLGTLEADVKTLWDANNLYVRVAAKDATVTSTDQIELFVVDDHGAQKRAFARNDFSITEVSGGYVLETAIPLNGTLGKQVKFDARVTDKGINDGSEQGGNGVIVSWSDPRNAQDSDDQGYGVLTYIEETRLASAIYGTPAIDGELDAAWANAPVYTTDVKVEQHNDAVAKAEFRTMWDEHNLYVYAKVADRALSDAIANAWEQDSVEIFVDQNNGKTNGYQGDDGQYRINYKNGKTVGGHATNDNYTSAARQADGGYVVETAIALDTISPAAGTMIGFDLQVNNDDDGSTRDSVFSWNDPTGQSYANTSRFGVLQFAAAAGQGANPGVGSGSGPSIPSSSITVIVDNEGRATANIGEQAFTEALHHAKAGRIGFVIEAPASAASVAVALSAGQVKDAADAGVHRIVIDTGLATFELPISLFESASRSDKIELSVSKADEAGLPDGNRSSMGQYAVVDLSISIGGKAKSLIGAKQSVKVAIPYTLQPGERAGQVVVYSVSEEGDLEVIRNGHYDAATGRVEFKMDHVGQYAVASVKSGFADLNQAAWAADSILALAARDIISGLSAEAYGPKQEITRAEFVQLLVRTLNLQPNGAVNSPSSGAFSDVKEGDWYYDAVQAAQQFGVINGRGDGAFGASDTISRQDMAVMTFRALHAAGAAMEPANREMTAFLDQFAIADYAQEAVTAMQQAGLINGMADGRFAPQHMANRAQAAVMLYPLLQLL